MMSRKEDWKSYKNPWHERTQVYCKNIEKMTPQIYGIHFPYEKDYLWWSFLFRSDDENGNKLNINSTIQEKMFDTSLKNRI